MAITYQSMTVLDLKKYAKEKHYELPRSNVKTVLLKAVIQQDLKNLTVSELKKDAAENGILVSSSLKKAELIEAIIAAKTDAVMGKTVKCFERNKPSKEAFLKPGRTSFNTIAGEGQLKLMAFAICPKCGEEIIGSCITKSQSDKVGLHTDLIKLFERCPNCDKKMGLVEGQYVERFDANNVDEIFSGLKDEIDTNTKRYYLETADGDVAEIKKPKELPTDNAAAQRIEASPELMKEYLMYLIHLESEVYFLNERQSMLQLMEYHNDQSYCRTEADLRTEAKQELNTKTFNLSGEIEVLKDQIKNPRNYIGAGAIQVVQEGNGTVMPQKPDEFLLTMPEEPQKPVMKKPKAPIEPEYATPGLFNKKRVNAENDEKKKAYENEVAKYNDQIALYEEKQKQYKNAMAQYREMSMQYEEQKKKHDLQMKAYKEAYAEVKQRLYEDKLKQYVEDKKEELEEKNKQVRVLKTELESEVKKQLESIPQNRIADFLSAEKKKTKDELKKDGKTRNELYSYNIIYGKYRNHIALTKFYEYLDSGRCDTLEGKDGAYNLFESEIRADEIILQMTAIVKSLEEIKAHQYMLYTELKQVNNNLNTLNSSMRDAILELVSLDAHLQETNDHLVELKSELKSINNELGDIGFSLEEISTSSKITAAASVSTAISSYATAKNTAIGAYYSAMTAHYAKTNAQMTNAQGFMIAMKK